MIANNNMMVSKTTISANSKTNFWLCKPLLVCFYRLQRRSVAIVGLAQISRNE